MIDRILSMSMLSVLIYAFVIGFSWSAGCWSWAALIGVMVRKG